MLQVNFFEDLLTETAIRSGHIVSCSLFGLETTPGLATVSAFFEFIPYKLHLSELPLI